MLSKSQAKRFFFTFTGGFSLVFLGLTVDTLRAVPERSHEQALNSQVVQGKEVWESNNCMGCHTLLGEGAYYAPELTRVYEKRGPVWMKTFLRDPQAMFPGERKMVQYDFSEQELDALVAFFEWVGKIDTNGFPAKPDLGPGVMAAPVQPGAGGLLASAPTTFQQICVGCHAVGGQGGKIGPALDGIGARMSEPALDRWLADPQAVKPGTAMPSLHLPDADRQAVVRWLATLK